MRRWVVVAVAVFLWAATAHAGGTIQVGLAGVTLPAATACSVTTRTGTYQIRQVIACETDEYFFVHFYNLPDASKTYQPTVAWRTESSNTATTVQWNVICHANQDGAADDTNFVATPGATSATNSGQRYVNLDQTSLSFALYSTATGAQCASSACSNVPVTCKVLLKSGIAGAEHDYIGMTIAATDS